jgi:hypothetical protein
VLKFLSLTTLKEAISVLQKLTWGGHFLGIGYARKGLLNQAIQEFQIAVALNPDNPLYRDNLTKARGTKTERLNDVTETY